MNISKITKVLSLVLATTAFVLVSGNAFDTSAQTRDPFRKSPYQKPQKPRTERPRSNNADPGPTRPKNNKPVKPKGPQVIPAPSIEARIDYYKRVREEAAMNGQPIPKVTSVLLVNEMTVSGVFKTPRGYAAIVEATPIKLSYTIYPGEKFFDGQLVAVEENRLVFRKVTKMSNNKFISSVENKPLRKYTLQQQIQGTTPNSDTVEPVPQPRQPQSADNKQPNSDDVESTPGVIVSPLEEMNNQPPAEEKDAADSKKSSRGKKGKRRTSKKKKRT